MNGKQYWKDKIPLLIINIVCMVLLSVFLFFVGNNVDSIAVILIVWTIVLAGVLAFTYHQRKRKLNKLVRMAEGLEEKYRLCPELPADTALIEVQGDKRLLKRAVRNLVSNSINHNPQGCQITIRLETEDRHCKVVIQDDGTGLSEQELNDLRKRPRYLSSTDEGLDLRHGIGLHLVRQIMDIHKARMVITSEAGNGVQTALLFQTLS